MSLSDVTDIDLVHRGSYVRSISSSLTGSNTPVTVSGISISNLLGVTTNSPVHMTNNSTAGLTDGVITDDMKITGISFTNTTGHSFMVNASFQYGEGVATNAHLPPFSTIHIVTADNPISWYGAGFGISIHGMTKTTLSVDEVLVHLSYQATTKV